MTKHRSPGAAFKRQVAEEFIAEEALHALPDGTGWLPEWLRVAETGEVAALTDFLAGEQGEEAVTDPEELHPHAIAAAWGAAVGWLPLPRTLSPMPFHPKARSSGRAFSLSRHAMTDTQATPVPVQDFADRKSVV